MTKLLKGKELSTEIREDLKKEVIALKCNGISPKLAVIMVGNDEASARYVKNKSKACDEVGIEYEEILMDANISLEQLLEVIDKLNEREDVHGILLQSPVPNHLDITKAFNHIDYKKDVDGFNPVNAGLLLTGQESFIPCTPLGVIKMLEASNIEICGKKVVVLGRSTIVGKPMGELLLSKDATVTICHSRTQDIANITRQADILIAAVGKINFVTEEMVKEGAVVIDVGINYDSEKEKLVGDVDFPNVSKKTSYITPVPGGVGPMTITMLMHNVVKAAKQKTKGFENNSLRRTL